MQTQKFVHSLPYPSMGTLTVETTQVYNDSMQISIALVTEGKESKEQKIWLPQSALAPLTLILQKILL